MTRRNSPCKHDKKVVYSSCYTSEGEHDDGEDVIRWEECSVSTSAQTHVADAGNLSAEQHQQLQKLLEEYMAVMSESLGKIDAIVHRIVT